jgi:hypothetical protein
MPRIRVDKVRFVPIVGEGAIGDPNVLGGRLVPVLILDCSSSPGLEDCIRAHRGAPPGDVTVAWRWDIFSRKAVYLNIRFSQPVITEATVLFDVARHGGVIQWILNARAAYLQPLSSGPAVSSGLAEPKVLMEVPPSASFPIWGDLYRRSIEKKFLRAGLTRREARDAALESIERSQDMQFRRKPKCSA